ncbi:MAG: cupin domain-containing protein [Chloroflexota bacterium]|nr:cupin domain-containing protein [Chloroflexota bacterium]
MNPGLNGHTDPFVLGPDESRGVGGGPWRTRVRGADTGGLLIIGDAEMPPMSAGPSLHVHTREDEASYVVAGVLTVVLGDERFEVPAGGIAWLPRGVPHTFANLTTEPVRVVGVAVPAGLEGMWAEFAAYFDALQGPPDPVALDEIGQRYGITVVGPPIAVPAG